MMPRLVKPEKLDSLDACDPAAQASRRDLSKINSLMGNYAWFEKVFTQQRTTNQQCLEIGAGDGELAIRLLQKSSDSHYAAVDRAPMPASWPARAHWHQGDLFQYTGFAHAEVLLANLILHHFEANELQQLGERIHQSALHTLIVNEPCRRSWHKLQLRAGQLIGFNHITLYDGSISIDAGFRADELPTLLGLDPILWDWQIKETFMGAYRMIAQRR